MINTTLLLRFFVNLSIKMTLNWDLLTGGIANTKTKSLVTFTIKI